MNLHSDKPKAGPKLPPRPLRRPLKPDPDEQPLMDEPSIGKENLGAVIGAVLGALGGLVAIAIPYALMTGNLKSLSLARTFGLVSFLVCTPVGWFAGGYLSHFLQRFVPPKAACSIGGTVGGLFPVTGVALYGWYLISR